MSSCEDRSSCWRVAARCAGAPAQAQDLKPWKHGVIEPKGDAGFMLMVGQRGFAEKHGLKLEIVSTSRTEPPRTRRCCRARSTASNCRPGATILAGARGADIKILGCDWPGVPHGLMVRSTITKVEDLKGKTVAVAAPGSLPNLLINAMLEKYKIPATEVRFANLGGDLDRFKAVVAGVADAGIVAAEFMAVAPKDVTMLVAGRDIAAELCAAVPDHDRQDDCRPARRRDQFRRGGNGRAALRRRRIATTPSR